MAKDDAEKEGTEAKGGGSKKLIIILVPVILLLAGAGWFFFLKPDKSGADAALPEPKPGAIVKLDSITINLAQSHFLKVGLSLQPTASAKEVDGAKALDLAIGQFSQKSLDELSTAEGRTEAKEALVARIKLAYLPEGTDIAAATKSAGVTVASTPAPTPTKGSGKQSETAAEHTEIKIADLSDENAIKMADALTVQPEIYDVYFTEFVMQ
jgi:flagellar protein FliL